MCIYILALYCIIYCIIFWSGWSLVRLQLREKGGSGLESEYHTVLYYSKTSTSRQALPSEIGAFSVISRAGAETTF